MQLYSVVIIVDIHFFFFFQAEDGIRDLYVTGVQTCALPILWLSFDLQHLQQLRSKLSHTLSIIRRGEIAIADSKKLLARSEERRVGKECRSRRSAYP